MYVKKSVGEVRVDRVEIVSFLFSADAGEGSGGQSAAKLGLRESTVSHRLGRLCDAGLVISARRKAPKNIGPKTKPAPAVLPGRVSSADQISGD